MLSGLSPRTTVGTGSGHLVTDEHAPAWWTLADAEGNEADVATWKGRE
ncbi:hypothetical protein HRW18_00110 [Streptomyces lunaelactis]|nr:hypothetical protein [Streptomyces lunaelactis]NUK06449.1 hypothetical protein [Streptomyces lunaelactis]NUL11838.1 hypothetical protein [Streptomyces lunaelactis]NUL23481.1 hypothetical protein [Streptomyces lunaelactis]